MSVRQRVYVSGPITHGDQFRNVRRAIQAASQIIAAGHAPFVPHLTCVWVMCDDPGLDYERWIEYDLSWIDVCDCLVRLEGHSPGADREVQYAQEHGIPVYTSVDLFISSVGKCAG